MSAPEGEVRSSKNPSELQVKFPVYSPGSLWLSLCEGDAPQTNGDVSYFNHKPLQTG